MKTRRLLLGGLSAFLGGAAFALAACAANEEGDLARDDRDPAVIPTEDAAVDGDAPAPCTPDCEWFVDVCTSDVFCPIALFDPKKPAGGPDSFDLRTRIHLVRGRGPNDVWAAGAVEALARFDGTSWRRASPPPDPAARGRSQTLWSLWFRDGYEVGGVGLQDFYTHGLDDPDDAGADHWIDRGAAALAPPPTYRVPDQYLTTGWGADGAEWFWLATRTYSSSYTPGGLVRVRVTAEKGIAGEVVTTTKAPFAAVHGASADDVWAVGPGGTAMRVTGADGPAPATAAYDSRTRNALRGVWAASQNDVWAVGVDGTIRHYTGDPITWDFVPDVPDLLDGVALNAVWGSSSSDIWAVGDRAVVLHYDGIRWSRVKIGGLGGRRPDLVTVWTAGPGRVWVGGDAVLLSLGDPQ